MNCEHESTALRRRVALTDHGLGTVIQRQCDSCLRGVGPALESTQAAGFTLRLEEVPTWRDRAGEG